MPKLLLVDLSGIFWSAWHATAGGDTSAAYNMTLSRIDSLRDGYEACVVCCDVGPSFRKELYPAYKAGRPERDPAAYDQLRRVRAKLEGEGTPTLHVDGFEADDLIATLAAKAPAAGYTVTIASSDKDLLQLVGPAVKAQSVMNGGKLFGPEEVVEKFGVRPDQIRDYLALIGDKSDNIPGAPGIGEVAARKLLTAFNTLEAVWEAEGDAVLEVLSAKQRTSLWENRTQVELAQALIALRFDVPLDFAESIKPRERAATKEIEPPPGEPEEEDMQEETEKQDVIAEKTDAPRAVPAPLAIASQAESAQQPADGAMVLDKSDPRWTTALEPRNVRQLSWFAQQLYESNLYRKFPNAAGIMAVILRGRSVGLDMMTALDAFHIIEGKPTMASNAIIALVLASGKAEYFELVEHSNESATWETVRRGGRGKPVRMTFTVQDAQRSGLARAGGNWQKWPGPMCRKQAGVELARAVYPDVVSGLYSPDETAEAS